MMKLQAIVFGLLVSVVMAADTDNPHKERPLVFGVNRVADPTIIYKPADFDRDVYARIREVGGTCVRLAASPRDIESERGKRDWTEFDRDLALAIEFGQEPMVLIVNTPAWASPTGEATHLYPYKTELLPDFGDFCTDLARRTRGKVWLFQLWNEQNGCSWHFHDGFNHADEYLPVLKVCYDAIKKGNPDAVLSLGSLDDAEGHAPIFMRKTYEEMKKQSVSHPVFDAVSDHPYSDSPEIMKGKLDALRRIMADNNDAGKPFWLTEYGWAIGTQDPELQARRMAETLAAFVQPDYADVEAAIYLCIGDFAGQGFGLCDSNLRPRPAFYAFQAASRFGAYPAFEIQSTFPEQGRVLLKWKTLKPTTCDVVLTDVDGPTVGSGKTRIGTTHQLELKGLKPGASYRYTITTTSTDKDRPRSIASAPYTIRCPDRQLFNGRFDAGFSAGIADGWDIQGRSFCTDGSLLPFSPISENNPSQALFVRGDRKPDHLNDTLSAVVAATPGRKTTFSLDVATAYRLAAPDVEARIGIDPTGQAKPSAKDIVWSDWIEVEKKWDRHSLSATADNSVVRVFVQCRSGGTVTKKGLLAFLVDNAEVAGN